MPLNSELKNLKFLIDSGINVFIQDTPNPIYQIKQEQNKNNVDIKIANFLKTKFN